ncbi:hypothetical protein EYF80_059684 [Liparis tanakae]|uniref:Uncharacterized protein n=1 Tax=Liparis tanakae TaxID=230148 RepID=A0A4Z2EN18_9TELE|nr:hypothetical protein EYF80_059684 [Liparis tanakae]
MDLLFLSSNQILPFLYRLGEVDAVHGDLDLADDVVFTETVKVEHLQHQRLTAQLTVGNLEREEGRKGEEEEGLVTDLKGEGLIEDGTKVLALDFGLELLLLVRQHVDLDVGVRGAAQVHGRQVLSLEDADYQLEKEEETSWIGCPLGVQGHTGYTPLTPLTPLTFSSPSSPSLSFFLRPRPPFFSRTFLGFLVLLQHFL